MGVASVAVYSEADAGSLHVAAADEAVCIGPAAAQDSYLNAAALLAAARTAGAEAIHPGYGFLSENADFAAACERDGLRFIGPRPDTIRTFGLKDVARDLARAEDVPLLSGSGVLADATAALRAAESIGYPVMLKATAGGGGIGMSVCETAADLAGSFERVSRLAASHFSHGAVFLEHFVREARHVEVQIFGDGKGDVVALGERDCSLQRRNQKVIEETPAPALPPAVREQMLASAVRLARSVRYRSAGTIEFLFDAARGDYFFLEVNTRLQVEHGVTEEVTGIDLVEWMVRLAAGDSSMLPAWREMATKSAGCSIQARVYAEDPGAGNRPSSGLVTAFDTAPNTRVETWITAGTDVGTHYDPLLAKIIVKADSRPEAVRALREALAKTRIAGFATNLEWLRQIAASDMFAGGRVSTRALDALPYVSRSVRVLAGGLATSVQDWPGRLGYWHVGVPPSGPMDPLAFRLGNRLLGNPDGAAGLEITATGPTLLFERTLRVCLTGADSEASLDDQPIPGYTVIEVAAGQVLKIGRLAAAGMRSYLLIAGGIDVPAYLGSRATFTLGCFGGHGGRNLAAGDLFQVHEASAVSPTARVGAASLAPASRPIIERRWRLRMLSGPHGAPDFFTSEDIENICGSVWTVHYNSNRTGVRLLGPKPRWARRDGGEAGLHPSNIHDNAYAIGALDFTGDMPILLGPDGPSLGGFVCPFVVVHADLWMLGQLAPGDEVRFEVVEPRTAEIAAQEQESWVEQLTCAAAPVDAPVATTQSNAILEQREAQAARPKVVYRRQGDRNLLVEYGPLALDLLSRLRVHALQMEIERLAPSGLIDVTPGIRSLQLHYDNRVLPLDRLLGILRQSEERLGGLEDFEIPTRVIWLPLSFNDPSVSQTIQRYMNSVRSDAPWCPDNIEFIRRINGLESADAVRRIVFDARYLVMGLGDVYLGAPVAIPLDPRHRLVTTKYNPARTWTPPNVVGIGGAYMCIYGMEGPGGYQLFGRTIQVWNAYRRTSEFRDGQPWLLRFFDQIRFFPVTHAELGEWRREFPLGRRPLRIETEVFRLKDYLAFLADNDVSIRAFQSQRETAFAAEREAWNRSGEFDREEAILVDDKVAEQIELPPGSEFVESPLGGNVWRVHVKAGDAIEKGAVIAAIEAMKTECSVPSPVAGIVRAVYVREKQPISPGTPMIALEQHAPSRASET